MTERSLSPADISGQDPNIAAVIDSIETAWTAAGVNPLHNPFDTRMNTLHDPFDVG